RAAAKPSEIDRVVRAFASRLGLPVDAANNENMEWIEAVAKDLEAHPGESIIIPGSQTLPHLQALCHAMNERLGNIGSTLNFTEPVEYGAEDNMESVQELVGAMNAGEVQTLLMLSCNPVYTAP